MTEEKKSNAYNALEVEGKIREFWEKEKIFKFDSKKSKNSKKKIYSIDTPPPTVSGKMHIGHAFSYSQQDFIARFRRMFEGNIYYPFGTDDNGLPTERLVEKTKKIKAKSMTREEFIKVCMNFLKEELPGFIQDWKNIGMSCDFDSYYSTINDYSRRISQSSFLDLYKQGRAYRKKAPFMWCPECQTAISQYELKDKNEETNFVYIIFDTNAGEKIKIATTRPELLPACVAIHVNPEDSRYKKFIGKKAKLPIFNREVKIYANKEVDMEFGTGAVYHCTFGDMDDVAWIEEINISPIEIINPDGTFNDKAGKYKGLKSLEVRKSIIEDLKKSGSIEKIEKLTHAVKVHERCDTPIEILMTQQWFIRYLDLKKEMLEWGKKLNWYPSFMKSRYDNWVNGLKWDWCISRQRFFGVPFPVWYCKKCREIVLADERQLPVNPLSSLPTKKCKCGSSEFEAEQDILDTWFTSSMTPRLAVEILDKKVQKKVFPLSLRPQAHDIITFWLFNTVLKSNLHYKENPFKDVMISGYVTLGGEKMSKSKGNVIDPRKVLEHYGADALRFWAAGSKLGEDLDYQEKDLIAGKRFLTKLWNASKFVFMNLGEQKGINSKPEKQLKYSKNNELFLLKLNKLVRDSTLNFEKYEYSKVKNDVERFFWTDFCDNYLEIIKKKLYNTKDESILKEIRYTLYQSLLTILKLISPICPFITEEIYQIYFKQNEKDESIHLSEWPKEIKGLSIKEKELKDWDMLIEIITKIRQVKSDSKKAMNSEIILTLDKKEIEELGELTESLKDVTNSKIIKEGEFKVEFI